MKPPWTRIYEFFFGPSANKNTEHTNYVFRPAVGWITLITITVIVLLRIHLPCAPMNGIATFLLAAGASFAGGAAIGFLFGLPRAEKYRFIKKDDADHNANDYSYGDNTNLEEVSDWLTKIIVGLTLIKLNTIIGWVNNAAHSINDAFNAAKCNEGFAFNAYVFGYCTIIFYFLAGAGLCYLWARTNLTLILTISKRKQQEVDKRRLMFSAQKLANPHLEQVSSIAAVVSNETLFKSDALKTKDYHPTDAFRNTIEGIYNAKPTYDKTDLQKGRWGGKAQNSNFVFEAAYVPGDDASGMYKLKLIIRSLVVQEDGNKKEVAFFLHDTFPSQVVFTVMVNGRAELEFLAYEAFVAGARLEDGTELELDLNKVPGFPEKFYWKE